MNKNDQPSSAKHTIKKVMTRILLIAVSSTFISIVFYFVFLKPLNTNERVANNITQVPQVSYYETIKNSLFKSNTEHVNHMTESAKQEEVVIHDIKSKKCYDAEYVKQLLLVNELKTKLLNDSNLSVLINQLGALNTVHTTLRDLVAELKITHYTQVESYYSIQKEFKLTYEQMLASVIPANNDVGLFCKYLSKIIVIRKVGERALKSGGVDAQIEQIKHALEDGNLMQLAGIANAMPDAQKDIAAKWLEKIDNLTKIQNIVDKIYDIVSSVQYQSNFITACNDD